MQKFVQYVEELLRLYVTSSSKCFIQKCQHCFVIITVLIIFIKCMTLVQILHWEVNKYSILFYLTQLCTQVIIMGELFKFLSSQLA